MEGVFDSDVGPGSPSLNVVVERASDTRANMNKCVQKSVRIMTNSTCLADELNLKYIDQQVQKTEVTKTVKKLGSIRGGIGYSKECASLNWFYVQKRGEGTEDETSELGTHIDAASRRYRFEQSSRGSVA